MTENTGTLNQSRSSGTRVTALDLSTGESEERDIENDFVVIVDGDRYVDGVVAYPKSGTVVVTIKRRKP